MVTQKEFFEKEFSSDGTPLLDTGWVSVEEKYPPFDNKSIKESKRYWVRVIRGGLCPEIDYEVAYMINPYRFSAEMDWVRVTHWKEILDFDEILEDNKEILKRLKEK